MRLIEQLALRRRALRRSQSDIAREIGKSPATVSRWESADIDPPAADLERYAAELGCSWRLEPVRSRSSQRQEIIDRAVAVLDIVPVAMAMLIIEQAEIVADRSSALMAAEKDAPDYVKK